MGVGVGSGLDKYLWLLSKKFKLKIERISCSVNNFCVYNGMKYKLINFFIIL